MKYLFIKILIFFSIYGTLFQRLNFVKQNKGFKIHYFKEANVCWYEIIIKALLYNIVCPHICKYYFICIYQKISISKYTLRLLCVFSDLASLYHIRTQTHRCKWDYYTYYISFLPLLKNTAFLIYSLKKNIIFILYLI